MPTIDESLIHAYLDDELDPGSRARVEEAAQADPRIARLIGELGRVRGLIAQLPRPPEAPDVSGAVEARIRQGATLRRALQPIAASTVLALAAMLVVTILWNRPRPEGGGMGGGGLAGAPASPTPDAPLLAARGGGDAAPSPAPAAEAPPGAEAPEAAPPPPAPAAEGPRLAGAEVPADRAGPLAFVLDLIEYPESRAMVVEVPAGAPTAGLADELDDLLRHTVRDDPRYGRIPAAGAGGDDRFVFLAGPEEREGVRARIEEVLGDRCRVVDAGGVDPRRDLVAAADSLVLQVAERGAPLRSPSGPSASIVANRQVPHHAEATLPGPFVPPSPRGGAGPRPVRPPGAPGAPRPPRRGRTRRGGGGRPRRRDPPDPVGRVSRRRPIGARTIGRPPPADPHRSPRPRAGPPPRGAAARPGPTAMPDDEPLPPYSYVPGGPRPHPISGDGGHLAGRPREAVAPIEGDNWRGSPAFLRGARLFDAGYYWEAHEAWEGLWHAHGRRGPVADVLKGLIAMAAAGVKVRQGQPRGASTHARRAASLFESVRASGPGRLLGIDLAAWAAVARRVAERPPADPGRPGEAVAGLVGPPVVS